jgi:hypothetical protein
MRKGPAVADDPTAEVTIQYPHTLETRTVPAGSLPGFTEYGWVVLDAAGRRKAQQPATPSKEN